MEKKTNKRRKCLIWTRVSSQEQLQNGSLNTQLTICTAYAQELGFNFIDHEEAFESAKQENTKFRHMLKKLTDPRNKYDTLIVLSASRFSRYLPTATNKITELIKKNIHLHVVRGKLNSESEAGILNLFQECLKANQENQERSEITKLSRLSKLKNGVIVSKPPLGYIRGNRKEKLDINNELLPSIHPCPIKAPLINKAFKLIIEKKNLTEVKDILNNLGLKLNRKYLGEILRKPIYAGKIIDKTLLDAGIPYIMGKHEKIISGTEFERVQNLLNKRTIKKNKKTFEDKIPLNGTLKCYKCKKSLTGYTTKDLAYYKCNHGCKLNIPGKIVHSEINKILENLYLDPEIFNIELV